jgi:hypothetical protein
MSSKGKGGDGVLLICGALFAICVFGPALALKLKINLIEMAAILAPIVGPALIVAFAVILFKAFWSRY